MVTRAPQTPCDGAQLQHASRYPCSDARQVCLISASVGASDTSEGDADDSASEQ